MKENIEVAIIQTGENSEEVIAEIKEKVSHDKAVILNLSTTEKEQVQKDIINFINETYKEFVHRISEKVYIISLKNTEQNVIAGDFWK